MNLFGEKIRLYATVFFSVMLIVCVTGLNAKAAVTEEQSKTQGKKVTLDGETLKYTYVTSQYSAKPKNKKGVKAERKRKIRNKTTYLTKELDGWKISGEFWSEEHMESYKFSYANTTGFEFDLPTGDYEVEVIYYNPMEEFYKVQAWDEYGCQTKLEKVLPGKELVQRFQVAVMEDRLRLFFHQGKEATSPESGRKTIYVKTISIKTLPREKKAKKTNIHIAADSIADYMGERYPRAGWGQKFYQFFDDGNLIHEKSKKDVNGRHTYEEYETSSVTIKNWATSGYSTRSFWQTGKFDAILTDIKLNDYVIICFGHNDYNTKKPGVYASTSDYKNNLKRFIKACQDRGAKCILLSQTPKCKFKNNKIVRPIPEYKSAAKTVAKQTGSVFLDVGKKLEELMNTIGKQETEKYYMVLSEGEYENYPEGLNDRIHFNIKGAKLVAHIIAVSMKENSKIKKTIRNAITADKDYYKGIQIDINHTTVGKKKVGNQTRYQLKWKKFDHAKSYIIYRYHSSIGKYKRLKVTKKTSYVFNKKWTKKQVKKLKVTAVLTR